MQQDGTQIIVDAMDDGANRKLCDAMARRTFKVKAKVSTVVSMGDKVGTAYNDTCRNSVYIPGATLPYTQTSNPRSRPSATPSPATSPASRSTSGRSRHGLQGAAGGRGARQDGRRPHPQGPRELPERPLEVHGRRRAHRASTGSRSTGPPRRWQDCFTIARWQDSKGGWVQATQKFPFCYPDAKVYSSPALEQGN